MWSFRGPRPPSVIAIFSGTPSPFGVHMVYGCPFSKNFQKKILVAFYEIARQWRKVNSSFIQLITRTFRKLLIENPTTSKRTPTRTQSKRDPPDEVPVNYRYRSSCICCIQYLRIFVFGDFEFSRLFMDSIWQQ